MNQTAPVVVRRRHINQVGRAVMCRCLFFLASFARKRTKFEGANARGQRVCRVDRRKGDGVAALCHDSLQLPMYVCAFIIAI